MRFAVYCQHLSGAGHFIRSREIVRALAPGHDVHFIVGGSDVPGELAGVGVIRLPGLHRTAGGLAPLDPTTELAETLARRRALLREELARLRPDVFVIEHFPLGKWELASEVLEAIAVARQANPQVCVASSVRDFPASNELAAEPARAGELLNEHFDALLVHADPRVTRLDAQFAWLPDVAIPIHYTGYVSQRPARESGSAPGTVLVSTGGLDDGDRLAMLSAAAWRLLAARGDTGGRTMVVVAGLKASDARFDALASALADGPFELRRFSAEFLEWMAGADLSISQSGYNTVMNVLQTRTRAILAPHPRMLDQGARARMLAGRGLAHTIDIARADAAELAAAMTATLARPRPEHDLALDGAERTRAILEHLAVETIPARVRRFARARPEQPAVRTPEGTISMRALDTESTGLGRAIRACAGSDGGAVALIAAIGPETAVGTLGILKSGRPCITLRASHPPARLGRILEDAQVALLVADAQHLELARTLAGRRIAVVEVSARAPGGQLEEPLQAGALASITYTSGSTGQPKGVLHTHASTLHLGGAAGAANIAPGDRVLSAGSSISFNRVLLSGAVSYPWSVAERGFAGLAEWMRAEAITVLLTVPSVLRAWLATVPPGDRFPALRRVVVTGETLLRKDLALLDARFPEDCLLVNELGCTETKSYAQLVVRRGDTVAGDVVPAGHALPGCDVRLLAEDGALAADGQVGELVVGAAHMSLGYWKLDALTQERFRPDPRAPDRRVYYTGDLARRLPDGALVHLGRKDFQIKIRGQRVELAEIEAQLCHLPGVDEAVVVARGDVPDGPRLVAYTTARGPAPAPADLARALGERLPAYMVPGAFVSLSELPRTPNGKVDRRALPAPPAPAVGGQAAAGSALEARIVEIFRSVFSYAEIGPDDDFFALGGHSLLAARLATAVEQAFARPLEPHELFHLRTPRALAAHLHAGGAPPDTALVALRPAGTRPPLFLLHGWGGGVFEFLDVARALPGDRPVHGLQATRPGAGGQPGTLEELAARYVREIVAFQPRGPYALGGYSSGGWLAYEVAQQLVAAGHRVLPLVLIETGLGCRLPGRLFLRYGLANLARKIAGRARAHLGRLLAVPPGELRQYLEDRWRSLRFLVGAGDGDPILTSAPGAAPVFRLGDHTTALVARYCPSPYPGRIDLFGVPTMRPGVPRVFAALARGGVRVHRVAGAHRTVLSMPHAVDLAGTLAAVLEDARRACP